MTLAQFWTRVDNEQTAASGAIRGDRRIVAVYQHAVALESWRHHLLAAQLDSGLPFWYEAHNDYLLSIVHAGHGIWRSSLQALRSFVENATSAVYYHEHSVEAKRFANGDFRLSWAETKQYFATYPSSAPQNFRANIWNSLVSEYVELSKAVHGSAEAFRMTAAQQFPTLSRSDVALIGSWRSRATKCARAVHMLLLQHFTDELTGARLPSLRADLGRTLSAADRALIRQALGIVVPPP